MQLRPDHEQQEWEQRLAEAKKLKAKDKAAAAAKGGLFRNSSAAAAGRYGRGWNPLGPHDEFTSAVLGRNLDALRARAESQQGAHNLSHTCSVSISHSSALNSFSARSMLATSPVATRSLVSGVVLRIVCFSRSSCTAQSNATADVTSIRRRCPRALLY